MRLPSLAILILLASLGCAESQPTPAPLASRVGSQCAVYIRPEVLGMASDLPMSARSSGLNGATTTLNGQLTQIGADWIVVETQGEAIHIPQACILMLSFGKTGLLGVHAGLPSPPPPATALLRGEHGKL